MDRSGQVGTCRCGWSTLNTYMACQHGRNRRADRLGEVGREHRRRGGKRCSWDMACVSRWTSPVLSCFANIAPFEMILGRTMAHPRWRSSHRSQRIARGTGNCAAIHAGKRDVGALATVLALVCGRSVCLAGRETAKMQSGPVRLPGMPSHRDVHDRFQARKILRGA